MKEHTEDEPNKIRSNHNNNQKNPILFLVEKTGICQNNDNKCLSNENKENNLSFVIKNAINEESIIKGESQINNENISKGESKLNNESIIKGESKLNNESIIKGEGQINNDSDNDNIIITSLNEKNNYPLSDYINIEKKESESKYILKLLNLFFYR